MRARTESLLEEARRFLKEARAAHERNPDDLSAMLVFNSWRHHVEDLEQQLRDHDDPMPPDPFGGFKSA